MLKIALLVLGATALSSTATVLFVGRTVHSSPFQMDCPYGAAIKTTLDPANIWSWHHTFSTGPGTAEVLVDVDGNNVMDTEHAWLRVMVTDIEVVDPGSSGAVAWIRDSVGRRFAAAVGGWQATGPVHHVALATPITLPVGSSLSVEMEGGSSVTEVHMIGRVVNL
jgi:hypothetical protein